MDVALVICSATAFAQFMRVHVVQSRAFQALRSTLLGSLGGKTRSNLIKSIQNPNRPRTGRDDSPRQKRGRPRDGDDYIEMSDTWLLNSGATVDVIAGRHDAASFHAGQDGLRVQHTVDVERQSIQSSS